MEKTDNTSQFEEQIMQSARRLRDAQNSQFSLRELPSPRRHLFTTWIASIAAAAIGWAVGISFPIGEETFHNKLTMQIQPDTVIQYKERLVHDTIIQKVEIPVKEAMPSTAYQHALYVDIEGCSVEFDGIDYEMLIEM